MQPAASHLAATLQRGGVWIGMDCGAATLPSRQWRLDELSRHGGGWRFWAGYIEATFVPLPPMVDVHGMDDMAATEMVRNLRTAQDLGDVDDLDDSCASGVAATIASTPDADFDPAVDIAILDDLMEHELGRHLQQELFSAEELGAVAVGRASSASAAAPGVAGPGAFLPGSDMPRVSASLPMLLPKESSGWHPRLYFNTPDEAAAVAAPAVHKRPAAEDAADAQVPHRVARKFAGTDKCVYRIINAQTSIQRIQVTSRQCGSQAAAAVLADELAAAATAGETDAQLFARKNRAIAMRS